MGKRGATKRRGQNSRVRESIPFTEGSEHTVRRAIKKHRGKILKAADTYFNVTFPSVLQAKFCRVRIDHETPSSITYSGSGALPRESVPRTRQPHGNRIPEAIAQPDTSPVPPRPEDFLLRMDRPENRYLEPVARERLASWIFHGVELSEFEKLIIVGVLGEQNFDYFDTAAKLVQPFGHYGEQVLQDLLQRLERKTIEEIEYGDEFDEGLGRECGELLQRLRSNPGWQIPEPTYADTVLGELAAQGIHPLEVLAAVAPSPQDVQRAAAKALRRGKRVTAKALTKFNRATAKLTLASHTPLRRLPVIRVVDLFQRKGLTQTAAFNKAERLLPELYPGIFGNLTADAVRQTYLRETRRRAKSSPDVFTTKEV